MADESSSPTEWTEFTVKVECETTELNENEVEVYSIEHDEEKIFAALLNIPKIENNDEDSGTEGTADDSCQLTVPPSPGDSLPNSPANQNAVKCGDTQSKGKLQFTNKRQFKRMIDLLNKQPEVARGSARFNTGPYWEAMAAELNSLGPPTKESTAWKKVWVDWKSNTKRKLVHNLNEQQATRGHKKRKIFEFTTLEERLIDIARLAAAVDGTDDSVGPGVESDPVHPTNEKETNEVSSEKQIQNSAEENGEEEGPWMFALLERQKVTTRKQFELMIEVLEKYPAVAKGLKFAEYAGFGKDPYYEVWNELAASLNSVGPPVRKMQEWMKVWNDLRLKVRKKLEHNQTEMKVNGGRPNRLMFLSSYEKQVAKLLSFQKPYEAPSPELKSRVSSVAQSSNSLGRALDNENDEISDVNRGEPVEVSVTPKNPASTNNRQKLEQQPVKRNEPTEIPVAMTIVPPRQNASKNYRRKLLEQQTDYLRELVQNSRESLRLQKETLELHKERLKLKKKELDRAEKHQADQSKFQSQVLEYKKIKLELLRSQMNGMSK
ncbi:uncharacterized protein LOC129775936 [Toxorhynchites rutilus septentrionalis]|uniref:uncharacterized protein LOC129775936 n=1 Tax=Toxorhynchites rutilus septentrionalis TaxID=329112 RepID=UPI002478B56E|nr:uncharacterized protein LOC129775936 [Toxorhynchites rutilus septentrionalis]